MSLARTITGLWKNKEETSERSKDPQLRTRYYKERYDKLIPKVLDVINQQTPWKVVHVDKERCELMLEASHLLGKHDIVITVFNISPIKSAIDIVSAKRGSLGDLGASYHNITTFFQLLHKDVQPIKE